MWNQTMRLQLQISINCLSVMFVSCAVWLNVWVVVVRGLKKLKITNEILQFETATTFNDISWRTRWYERESCGLVQIGLISTATCTEKKTLNFIHTGINWSTIYFKKTFPNMVVCHFIKITRTCFPNANGVLFFVKQCRHKQSSNIA